MKAIKIPKISAAQARALAKSWCGEPVSVSDNWNNATILAIKKRELIEPTGTTGVYPSGTPFQQHRISLLGKGALADFLWNEFTKEMEPT
ncbi:MAG: hypothetical protein H0X01_02030 [Nitrospira sp.]|nr:hypothetical protein [Nitrospira sp.]